MDGNWIAYAVIGAASLAAWVWMSLAKRRDDRAITKAAAESAGRAARRAVEVEAQRVVDAAARREVDAVIAIAESYTQQAVFDENLRHLDDLAHRHPMPKRPAPPPPAPGEPWQLHIPDFPTEAS
jgi:hypothetical protein